MVDQIDHVDIVVFEDVGSAERAHAQGVARLLALSLPDQRRYLQKQLPGLKALGLQYAARGDAPRLQADLIDSMRLTASKAEKIQALQDQLTIAVASKQDLNDALEESLCARDEEMEEQRSRVKALRAGLEDGKRSDEAKDAEARELQEKLAAEAASRLEAEG